MDSIEAELCPCVEIGESAGLAYHKDMTRLSNRSDITGKSLRVRGWFQSWKYTVGVESALRHHLRLLPHVSDAVRHYLDQIRPSAWKAGSYSRIAIHVRVGDLKKQQQWNYGYTVPQRPYFEQVWSGAIIITKS